MHGGGTVTETHTSTSAEDELRSFSPRVDTSVSVTRLRSYLIVRGGRGGHINSKKTANKCQPIPSAGGDDLPTVALKHPQTEDRT